jgi:hypothetical protein
MGTIGAGFQNGVTLQNTGEGGLEGVAQELQQAANTIEQAVGGLQQAGGYGGQSGFPSSPGGLEQGGPQGGIQGELAQIENTLQQLTQDIQGGGQGVGGASGGAQPQSGTPGAAEAPGAGGGFTSPVAGNINQVLPALQNLIGDSAGNDGKFNPESSGNDLAALKSQVQTAMNNGTMNSGVGDQVLGAIGSGNISQIEKLLTGTSENVTGAAQASVQGAGYSAVAQLENQENPGSVADPKLTPMF